MAGSPRHAPGDLSALGPLRAEPWRFTLFGALRLLENAYRDHPRFGEARRAVDDPVRLRQPPYLSFAESDVVAYGTDSGPKPTLDQYGFGMFGPNGALPLHLTEFAYQRLHQLDDPTVAAFVNVFHHRMIALFYRAWAETEPTVAFDRPQADRFRLYLGALMGLGSPGARDRDAVPDYAKLSRVGLFADGRRCGEGLAALLSDYFELPIDVRSYLGGWLDIPEDARSRLGGGAPTAALGLTATLGAATWQCQHRFEIVLGPVAFDRFEDFLPGRPGLEELAALVRLYTNDEWSWSLRLVLASGEVPAARCDASRIGWTAWLGGRSGAASDVAIEGDSVHRTSGRASQRNGRNGRVSGAGPEHGKGDQP